MKTTRFLCYSLALIAVAAIVGYASAVAQQGDALPQVDQVKPAPKADGKFEFEIIQSFDAQYLGDTPGHIGKHGELGDLRPQIALGDPVFRGDEKIGQVSNLVWSRGHGSLEVTIDPEPKIRICVGDLVWVKMTPTNTK